MRFPGPVLSRSGLTRTEVFRDGRGRYPGDGWASYHKCSGAGCLLRPYPRTTRVSARFASGPHRNAPAVTLSVAAPMYHHIKKLMYTVNVGQADPRFGNMLLEQFGGANGELAAAMQYTIQGL